MQRRTELDQDYPRAGRDGLVITRDGSGPLKVLLEYQLLTAESAELGAAHTILWQLGPVMAVQPHHVTLTKLHFFAAQTAYRHDRMVAEVAYVDFRALHQL